MANAPSPSDHFKNIRESKLRAEAEVLKDAASITMRMNCHGVANALYKLAKVREDEAKALTPVSAKERRKT